MRLTTDRTKRLLAGTSILIVLLAGSSLALAQTARVTGQGWIDQPLSWEPIAVGEYEVIAHVTDKAGVVAARLDVDGVTVAEKDLDGETISVVEFLWTPPGPGVYTIEVFGRSPNGTWGSPGFTTALVGQPSPLPEPGDDEPEGTTTTLPGTTTSVPGATTTTPGATTTQPTTTTTQPTTTTTACVYPAPATGNVQTAQTAGNYIFNWTYNGCTTGPIFFLIQVARENTFPAARTDEYMSPGTARSRQITINPCLGDYHWRLRVVDADGAPLSDFSQTAVFSCP